MPEASPPRLSAEQPFPGLSPFERNESAWFFGRGREKFDILSRLREIRFVAVVGPSGCGKSSLIKAGVLSTLDQHYLGSDWRIVSTRPGDNPLDRLAGAIGEALPGSAGAEADLRAGAMGLVSIARKVSLPENGKLLVLVDQFEELFQFVRRADERTESARRRGDSTSDDAAAGPKAREEAKAFIKLLLAAALSETVPVYIIITMRSEWLGHCSAFSGLAEAINEGLYLVPEMSRAEMRKAIIQPIVQAGGEIVSPLVDRMLNDLDGRTDQLPVLQHALMRMWNRREPGEPLSPADYTEVGGFSECLSNHAGKLFEDLPKEQQPVAMALFKAITETTPDNRQVRRQSTAKAVAAATGYSIERLRPAAEAFSEGGTGFVVVSPSPMAEWSILDISHEALIRQWRLLRGWVEEEGTARRAVDRLEEVADEWKKKTAEDDRIAADYLLRGARLEATQLVANRPGFVASPATTEFLAASRNAENRSVRKRRLGWFLLVSIGLGVFIYASETRISLVRSEKIAVESEKKVVEDDRKAARDQLADVAQRVETVCGTSYGPAAGAPDPICSELRKATLSKRVFLQIGSEARMAAAKHCADQLSKAGFGVHGIELVHDVPETTQVRYFSEGDHGQADDIAVRLGACGEPGAKVVKLEDARAGPGLIEIWFRTSALKLETRVNAKDGLVYVLIPKGTGLLGCPAADPECKPGQATIQNPFWIGQTEVTQAAFDKLMGANPSKFRDPALPADSVTWDEAVSYCAAAGGRLPAEAEWEYAARAGSTGPHYGPADSVAWYGATSSGHPHTPRGKSKNAFGLYDTLGNLWEWTADEYVQAYQKPSVPPKYRALRGGAWNSDLGLVQLSIRNGTYPSARRNDFGFRCVTDKLP